MKVSVILPVYNGLEYLPASIESILCQSFKDFELIIIDDGSTESVMDYLSNLHDPRVQVYSRENRGLGATLNELIKRASGEILFRMDADDIAAPDRLERQLEAFNNDSSLVLVGGAIRFVVGKNIISARRFPHDSAAIRSELLTGRFPLCHPAIAFRKSAAIQIGGYRLQGAGEDLDFFLRMTEIGGVANVPEVVLDYRLLANSLSQRKRRDLVIGYKYAIECAQARSRGVKEVEFEDFLDQYYKKEGVISRCNVWLDGYSESLYRRSLFELGDGMKVRARLTLVLAALLTPQRAVRRVITDLCTR